MEHTEEQREVAIERWEKIRSGRGWRVAFNSFRAGPLNLTYTEDACEEAREYAVAQLKAMGPGNYAKVYRLKGVYQDVYYRYIVRYDGEVVQI